MENERLKEIFKKIRQQPQAHTKMSAAEQYSYWYTLWMNGTSDDRIIAAQMLGYSKPL